MRRLWITDVHANLSAFEAVLADAGEVDEVVFLGDIVGYGPHPAACVDLLQQIGPKAIAGNHDAGILAVRSRTSRQTDPVSWDEWTFDRLSAAQLSYLASLPTEMTINFRRGSATAVHHPPGAPYLHPAMPDEVLENCFQTVCGSVVFCGHSHRLIDRTVDGRRFVCLPAVGQQRNGDPRAGYALEESGELDFRFVEFDIERCVADTEKIGLEEAFCRRWIRFIRSGHDAEWSREYLP